MNEGAGAGGDGIIVVLKGFPSFLHRKYHITKKRFKQDHIT
jgi:hypothetical protein